MPWIYERKAMLNLNRTVVHGRRVRLLGSKIAVYKGFVFHQQVSVHFLNTYNVLHL